MNVSTAIFNPRPKITKPTAGFTVPDAPLQFICAKDHIYAVKLF
jgi:hypothetical protein